VITKAQLANHITGLLGLGVYSVPCSYNGSGATLAYNGMANFETAVRQGFGVTFDDTGKPAGLLMVGKLGFGGEEIPVFTP
jgi:hypothetical protein